MQDLPDSELIRQYAEQNSEAAFAEVVRRYVNLVYSAAARKTRNPHAAEEVTQAVFIILAKKAGSLRKETILSGWLYQTARWTAANFLRNEIRRAQGHQEASMQLPINETGVWPEIEPLLEDAMGVLNEKERNAIVARFFEGRNFQEIGQAFGGTENAAKKRVIRGLEKLRKFLAKRGVSSTTAIIADQIATHSVKTAPVALAKSVTAVATAKTAAASTSTLTLVKGALKIMAWTKTQTAIVTGTAVVLAAGTTGLVVKKIADARLSPGVPVSSATNPSWVDDPNSWETDSRVLKQLPSGVFVFRPTRFPDSGGAVWVGERMALKNYSVGDIVDAAYGSGYTRTVFAPRMPTGHFDVMATVPRGSRELLKEELRKRFGITAHRETRQTDVLLLKVKDPNPPNLKQHVQSDGNSSWVGGNNEVELINYDLSGFFNNIESTLGQIVLNETRITGNYDLRLNWQQRRPGETDKEAYKRVLLEQAGLELVPDRANVELLVVEKTN